MTYIKSGSRHVTDTHVSYNPRIIQPTSNTAQGLYTPRVIGPLSNTAQEFDPTQTTPTIYKEFWNSLSMLIYIKINKLRLPCEPSTGPSSCLIIF